MPEPPPAAVTTDPAGQALLGWCRRLPKVELHLHLEGAIPHDALWELVRKYGGDADLGGPAGLAERFRYRDFARRLRRPRPGRPAADGGDPGRAGPGARGRGRPDRRPDPRHRPPGGGRHPGGGDRGSRARRLELHTTVHAGEAAGPASVWGAIEALRPERIGHGTRAAEDPALVGHLAATRLPVEACPLSNVATGVVGSLEEHPIRRLRDAGALVTVNTDDPRMFGNSLAEEYALLQGRLGFSADEVRGLLLDAVAASWLPAPRKQQLADAFRSDPAWSAHPPAGS